ncbi:MAG: HupE/UreJ family protein [Gammaproteobacteria bacterium]|nr:HupE/UreJ family protein [Gammaproteobacteria bacterium]
MRKLSMRFLLPSLAALLAPAYAFAHPSAVAHVHSFDAGFGHPFVGLDHMLAMVAVGLWAAQLRGRAMWIVPAAFVGVMMLGGVLALAGVSIPFVEQGILASVVVFGILIAAATRLPIAVSAALVGVFAVLHGHAHVTEMPLAMDAMEYGVGFALATTLLHVSGMSFGLVLNKWRVQEQLFRAVGVAIAATGLYLAIV